MKGYENYPAHWETMSVKRIFYCVSGNGFKIELQGKLQGDYPFCKVSDLNGEERDIKKAKFYVDVQTVRQERFNIVPEWSILFAKIGEALKKNHRKINLVPCCIDNNCAALIVRNNNFSIKYGYYVMKCIDMACFDNGGTIPYVDMKQLMIYKIPVPSKDEQDQIARFLDWKITAIDKLISIRREELRNLAELRKALITREVTRGNWERVRLKRVAKINPPCDSHGLKPEDIVTFAPMECIRTDRRIPKDAPLSNNNSSYTAFNNGDIALAKVTPCFENDNICVMENLTNGYAFGSSELFNIRPFNIDTKFLLYYFMTHSFKSGGAAHMTGAIGLKRVPSKYLRNVLVPLPPITEQKRIANYLDEKCTQIDSAITNFTQQIDTLKELKACLISDAVTGKIDVRNISVPEEEEKS